MRKKYYFILAFFMLTCSVVAQITITGINTLCAGESTTLTATTSGSSYGTTNYIFETIPYAPQLFFGGTVVDPDFTGCTSSGHDDCYAPGLTSGYPIGFSFCFFNQQYDHFWVGSNGWIGFTNPSGQSWTTYVATTIPNTASNVPKNCIFAPWQDWYPGANGSGNDVYYYTTGTAPDRKLVVYWNHCPLFDCQTQTANRGTFMIVLNESTSIIENFIQLKPECSGSGSSEGATQGVINLVGDQAYTATGRNYQVWTAANEGTRFTPSGITWYKDAYPGGTQVGYGTTLTVSPTATTTYYAVVGNCDGTNASSSVTVTVNPRPSPMLTGGLSTSCQNDVKTYTTDTGGSNYTWTYSGTWIAGGGTSDNTVTLKWSTTGPNFVSINYSNASGCQAMGATTLNLTVNPFEVPVLTTPASEYCAGVPVTFTTQPGKTNYVWDYLTSGATWISGGSPADNTLVVSWAAPGVKTVTVNYTDAGCTGDPPTPKQVTIKPIPSVNGPLARTICSGSNTSIALSSTPPGSDFAWNLPPPTCSANILSCPAGLSSGTSIADVLAVTDPNPGLVTYHIAPKLNGCVGNPQDFAVTVNPIPTVNAVVNQVLCHNEQTAAVPLAGNAAGTVFTWTNDTPSIGLAAAGTGDIAPFTVVNTTSAPITATITVTPAFTNAGATCTGTPVSFTITVNPLPAINPVASQVLCPSAMVTAISFTGNVPGTIYGWTNDTPTIGLPPAGSGNISSFAATNATNLPVTATITVTPSFTNAGHTCTGLPLSFTITVNPQPNVNVVDPQVLCHNMATNQVFFTGDVPSTVFAWTNTNPSIGLAATGTGDIASFTVNNVTSIPQVATIDIHPSFTNSGATCSGTPHQFQITVNPIPTVDPLPGQVLCHGASTTVVTFTGFVPGTVYSWTNSNASIGLAAAGTGDIAPFSVTNTTSAPVTATITATPTFNNTGVPCTGNPVSFTITVNPIPTVNAIAGQVLCHNVLTNAVNYTGFVPGTVYSWSNTNPSIGLAAAGTGDIPPFTAINNNPGPVTATITVTPSFTNTGVTCMGTPASFSITVNPVPTVNALANQVLCNQSPTTAVNYSGNVPGTVYSWFNTTPSIGLAAAGTGNIVTFTAVNTTNAPVTSTITVTPLFTYTAVTCTGTPSVFTMTVNPTPTVNAIAGQVLCHNVMTNAINYTGYVPGTVYNWTNTNPAIGLAAAGTGDIPAFTAINATPAPVTATITVTPSYTNAGLTCTGTPASFSITVNPVPTVNTISSQVVCHQSATLPVNFTGNVPGTIYTWTNTNASTGLAAAGTGNISAFTALNTTAVPQTSAVTVTPLFTNAGVTCTGTPLLFTFTVNPIPTVNGLPNQVLCHNASTAPALFTGFVPGTVYSWTNTNPSIGLAAAGAGDIGSFAVVNTGIVPATATITISPSFTNAGVTCTGISTSFTITVNPVPMVNTSANQVLCHQFTTAPVTYTGSVPGTIYSWTNSNPSIGLGATGTGNITPFTATNTTAAPLTATITVTPSFTNAGLTCTGNPSTFTITVNPLPVPTITGPAAVCLNVPATYTTEDFQSGYFWNVVAGGNIISGQSTKQAVVNWTALGTHSITVNWTDANGCTAQAPVSRQIVVNSLPNPTITGATTVCAGDTKTYQTQTGATSYAWGLPPSGFVPVAGGGSLDDFVTIKWTVAGSYTISVNYVVGTGCTAAVPTNYGVTVNALPSPQITGPSPVCALSTQNYTLTPVIGGHLYSWTVAGGTIMAGQNGSTVQVWWGNTAGGSLDLTETIGYPGVSCSAPATTLPVVLEPWPAAADTITGQKSVCRTSTYPYTIPVITNATSYLWSYSGSGVTLTNNGSAAITITFTASATSGSLTVKGVNNCGSGTVSKILNIAVHNLPEVSFTPCFDVVTTSGAKKIVLRGATPWLAGQGVFSGARVSLNALTGLYEFDPLGDPAGNYAISYAYTNTYGCMASAPAVTINVQNNSFSCGGTLTDVRDGKTYKTAWLSGQCWMTENLAYGTSLVSPGLPQTDNCVPERYCAPSDATCSAYGGMYQWDELMDYTAAPAAKGICPPEWHVPTMVEWQSLIDNLVAGVGSPDANAISGSTLRDVLLPGGFHALLGGLNYEDNTWSFTGGSVTGTMYWTSNVSGTTRSVARGLNIFNPSISLYSCSRGNAFSVRCVKN